MKTTSVRRVFSLALIVLLTTATLPAQLPTTGADNTEPDSPDYDVLRGVLIEMKDGRRYTGYVGWGNWHFSAASRVRFPQSLVDPAAYGGQLPDQLEMLTEVYQAAAQVAESVGTEKLLVTVASGWLGLPTEQIARITAQALPHDGHPAEYIFFDFLPASITLLTKATPHATFANDDTGSVLISYDNQIGQRELAKLGQILSKLLTAHAESDFAAAWTKAKRQLERHRVVVIDRPSCC